MKKKLLFIALYFIVFHHVAQQTDFKHINFKKADSIAHLYKNNSLNNLPLLSYKLTYRLNTDVEKFRAIYMWVCKNIKSDYNLTEKVLSKGEKYRNNPEALLIWNTSIKDKFLKKLLTEKKTICTGYAFLTKELCALANIDCKIINGYAKSPDFNTNKLFPNHSWNAVKLNNKWYLCDPTYASGYFSVEENKSVFDYNDGYFLTDPNLFVINHYPTNKKWLLTSNTTYSIQNYIDAPFIYGETYKHKITPLLPNTLEKEVSINEKIPFEFYIDTKLAIEKITLTQSNGWKEKTITPKNYIFKNGIFKFNHQFVKKGLYDVHIKVADEVIVSYTIKVTKSNIL